MNVSVRIVGTLIRPQGRSELVVDCDDRTTIEGLLHQLGYRSEHVPLIAVAVNGALAHHGMTLTDGDEVILSMTVGGG